MADRNSMDRRSFNEAWVMALLGGAAITISEACGSSSPTGNPTPTQTAAPTATPTGTATASAPVSGSISGNHGHVATITGAQLDSGMALNLDIQGSAGHTHNVSLTSDDVTAIRNGSRISQNSTVGNGHTHTVTFN